MTDSKECKKTFGEWGLSDRNWSNIHILKREATYPEKVTVTPKKQHKKSESNSEAKIGLMGAYCANKEKAVRQTMDADAFNTMPLGKDGFKSFLTSEDLAHLKECFTTVNKHKDSFLDCEELKLFMELRNTPITHLLAKDLVFAADSNLHVHISLPQIIFLAQNYGFSTQHIVHLTEEEYDHALHLLTQADNYVFKKSKVGSDGKKSSAHVQPNISRSKKPMMTKSKPMKKNSVKSTNPLVNAKPVFTPSERPEELCFEFSSLKDHWEDLVRSEYSTTLRYRKEQVERSKRRRPFPSTPLWFSQPNIFSFRKDISYNDDDNYDEDDVNAEEVSGTHEPSHSHQHATSFNHEIIVEVPEQSVDDYGQTQFPEMDSSVRFAFEDEFEEFDESFRPVRANKSHSCSSLSTEILLL